MHIALHFAASNSSSTSMKGVEGVANKTTQMQQQALNLMCVKAFVFCFCVGGKDKKERRGAPPFLSLRKQIQINKLTVTTEPAGFAKLNSGKFNQKFSYLSVLLLLL